MKIYFKNKCINGELKGCKVITKTKEPDRKLIARYKFDKSIYENLVPEFNAEFTDYKIVDKYLDTEDIVTTNTETMMIMDYDAEPDEYGILTTEYEVEHVNTFSAENIVTRSIYSDILPTSMIFGTSAWSEHTGRSDSLLEILYLNSNELNNARNMFNNCRNLCRINASNLITNKMSNIQLLFHECANLTVLDASNWDTSSVDNMWGAFQGCTNLTTLNTSNWNIDKVKEFGHMFSGCHSLTSLDTSNWNTNKVHSMQFMFNNCKSLITLDVSNFDTSNVTNVNHMFCGCQSLTALDVSKWDTSKVINMQGLFHDCYKLTSLDVSKWDVSNVTNLLGTFHGCRLLTSLDLSNWDTSNVTVMGDDSTTSLYSTFSYSGLKEIKGIEALNVGKVTSMHALFRSTEITSLDLSDWDTNSVTNMSSMFYDNQSLTSLDLSNFDTSNVTTTNNMFDNCTNLISITMNNSDYNSVNKIIAQLPTRTSDSTGALYIEGVDDHKLVNKSEAGLRHWVIMTVFPNIKYYTLANEAEGVFTYPIFNSDESVLSNSSIYIKPIENEGSDETVLCIEIEIQDDINSIQFVNPECLLKMLILDTSNMTTMKDLFKNCTQLNSIECSDWDTSNVTDMSYMFTNCQNLTTLDVSNFDTSNVTDMSYMFTNCQNLTTLDVSNFDTSNVTDMNSMFQNCTTLNSISMNNSDYNSVNKIITQLLTRTTDFMGTLNITGVDDISQVDTATAESKYWTIDIGSKISLGETMISALYLGNNEIISIYLGSEKIL